MGESSLKLGTLASVSTAVVGKNERGNGGLMSTMGRAAAPVGAVDSRTARRNLRLAWISLAVLPLAFVGAMFLGDGLLTSQGYQSGDADIPAQVALRAGIPALLVLVAPAIGAGVFGLRARRLGMPAGAIPALVGLVVAAMSILLNVLPLALGL